MSSLPSYAEFSQSTFAPAFFSKTGGGSPTRVLNRHGCYDPYAFQATPSSISESGSNTFAQSGVSSDDECSEQGLSFPPSPSNVRQVSTQFGPPMNTFHAGLWRQMELIQIPSIIPSDSPTPVNAFPLFIGQVRFETTCADLRWIIRRVTGTLALKIEPRGVGCFIGYFKSSRDADSVRRLHKRLLFDHSGVWFARTALEVESLFDYSIKTLPGISRRCHLPRDCMTVEEVKSCFQQQQMQQLPAYHSGNWQLASSEPSTVSSCLSTPLLVAQPSCEITALEA